MVTTAGQDPWVLNLNFHGVGPIRRQLGAGEERLWLSLDAFRRILDEVLTWPSVQLSFDDGHASDLEFAVSELEQRSLRATFFVLAGRLEERGSLSAGDVAELAARGMSIGSHGMDHRSWRRLDERGAERELVHARDLLIHASGQAVSEAALPYGEYDRTVLNRLREAQYGRVFTTERRRARPGSWLQPRFVIRNLDNPATLRAEVLGPPALHSRIECAVRGFVHRWR